MTAQALRLAVLALAFGVGWWVNGVRWEGRLAVAERVHAEVRQQWADRAMAAEAEQRRIERARQVAIDEVQKNAEQQIELVRGDADRTGDALNRLQQRYAAAVASGRTCGNSITAQLSETADGAARVSADVLGRIGEAARLYAAEADRRGVAGSACEAAYGSLSDQ